MEADPGERVSQMKVFCCSGAWVWGFTTLTEEVQVTSSRARDLGHS